MIRSADVPVTAVQRAQARKSPRPLKVLFAAVVLSGLVALVGGGILLARFAGEATPRYDDIRDHFLYASIGSEPESGVPLAFWRALPRLYPEAFESREDYSAFGFLYESGRELPVGVSRREVAGVELVWLNCAVCHTGVVRETSEAEARLVLGMPANTLRLHDFFQFLLKAADDAALAPEPLFAAMEASGEPLGPLNRLIWRALVLPQLREGLLQRRERLLTMLRRQPDWGPGRVDTFNPYKALHFGERWDDLSPEERIGVADLPSIFLQGPREGMFLHWDGNNPSLQERNLSAAIGAGVTPQSVDHPSIERVADWLLDLEPPPSPYPARPEAERGRDIYMAECAACHGWKGERGYVFEGERLGRVTPIEEVGTDPARLNSYTERLAQQQTRLFAEDPAYRFRHFRKTGGYANQPLDGLWLRAPYLHNGAAPTLRDLLSPPEARPRAFVRGLVTLDPERGGFVSPPCEPGAPLEAGWCFDTSLPGNGSGGHLWGVDLPELEKDALLAYLMTF
jgi:hypothetical protein